MIANCAVSFASLGLPIKKLKIPNIDTHPGYEITCTEIINHYFFYCEFCATTKCIAWASMDGGDSNNTEVNAAAIHEIHAFIAIVFLRVKLGWVTVGSHRCSRGICVRVAYVPPDGLIANRFTQGTVFDGGI